MTSKDDQDQSRNNRLEELAEALKEAQLMLVKQSARLESVDEGEADSARELAEMRNKLAVITAERDQLQNQLLALERLQTETIALTDDSAITPEDNAPLPTIDDLMAEIGPLSEERAENGSPETSPIVRLGGPSAESPETELDEMISPTVIAPEEFANRPEADGLKSNQKPSRFLIYMDGERPIRVPLQVGTMTIGRSESANIRLDGQFVSRIHARIVTRADATVIEDAGSKNGFKVNSIAVKQHTLQHGDVINIGKRRFTFVDSSKKI